MPVTNIAWSEVALATQEPQPAVAAQRAYESRRAAEDPGRDELGRYGRYFG